jgi:bifunctional non-homologous end joining protein LigD
MAPSGSHWLHEIKHDGYRVVCVVDRGAVRIFTRRGHDWAERMPGIVKVLEGLGVSSAVIDGESIMTNEDGVSDFFALHSALARRQAPHATFMAFDLLHLDGEDLRGREPEERRAILADVINRPTPALQISDAVEGDGTRVLEAAREMGLEGIVSKRKGSKYVSGKAKAWRKTKCSHFDHFGVLGCDWRRRSLRLARLDEGELVPCGFVGSGLSATDARRIKVAIDVGQAVVAEVEYRGTTPAGELRHALLKRWQAG